MAKKSLENILEWVGKRQDMIIHMSTNQSSRLRIQEEYEKKAKILKKSGRPDSEVNEVKRVVRDALEYSSNIINQELATKQKEQGQKAQQPVDPQDKVQGTQ